jgi:hypothetical protein
MLGMTDTPAPTHAEIQANPDNYSDEQKADALLAEIEKMPAAEQKRVLMYLAGIPEDKELETVILRAPNGQLKAQIVSLEDSARIRGMGVAGFTTASFTNRHRRRAEKAIARRAKTPPSKPGG